MSGTRGAVIRGSPAVFAVLAVGKRLPRHTPTCEVTASTAVILRRPGVRNDGGGRRPAELPPRAPSPAAAPVAAKMAIDGNRALQDIDTVALTKKLRRQGAILEYVPNPHNAVFSLFRRVGR